MSFAMRLLQSYNFVLAVGQDGDIDSIVVIVMGQRNDTASNASTASLRPAIDPPPGRGRGGGDK